MSPPVEKHVFEWRKLLPLKFLSLKEVDRVMLILEMLIELKDPSLPSFEEEREVREE